jgi:magnesium transporter
VIALRNLIVADPSILLEQMMRTEIQVAHVDDEAEEVAQKISEYNLLALPVVDEAGEILGIVTVDDAMEILLPKDWRQRLPRFLG